MTRVSIRHHTKRCRRLEIRIVEIIVRLPVIVVRIHRVDNERAGGGGAGRGRGDGWVIIIIYTHSIYILTLSTYEYEYECSDPDRPPVTHKRIVIENLTATTMPGGAMGKLITPGAGASPDRRHRHAK